MRSALLGPFFRRIRTLNRPRVPVLLQLSAVECGAACLAMILGYYGRRVSVTECRALCAPGRDGVNALTIVRAARQYGLSVRSLAIKHTDFSSQQLPAIIHWNFNHFVVLERWTPTEMQIVDPASGRRCVSAETFSRSFTGIAIICAPGPGFQSAPQQQRSAWRLLAGYLRDVPGLLFQLVLSSLLLQGLGLALPALLKLLIDGLGSPTLATLLSRVALGLALVLLIRLVVQYVRSLVLLKLQLRFDTEMMEAFLRRLLALPFRFFEQRSSADLLLRLGSNRTIHDVLTNQSLALVLDGLMMGVYFGSILAVYPPFAVVLGIVGLLQLGLLVGARKRTTEATEHALIAQTATQSYLLEALSGVATIKAAGAEQLVLERWRRLFRQQARATLQQERFGAQIHSLLITLQMLTPLLLLYVGVQAVAGGALTLGTMLALHALGVLALMPVASLVAQVQRFQAVSAYLERLRDVLEAPLEQTEGGRRIALQGGIELQDVAFRYDAEGPPVLHEISLTIAPGQKVALVGRSGSGKSTLAKLLLGLYSPSGGTILYDGVPQQELDIQHLRQQYGVVLQEPFLFSGSLRENILFSRPTADTAQVIRAAQLAGIHDEIMRMPLAYETRISEGGHGLSGGQLQRLALARALLHPPAILLLDEATSNLDPATEREIEGHLSGLTCTRIVIAHRLSTVRDADLIVVLDGGRIVERGDHAALMAAGGLYAALSPSPPTPLH